jgi:hypothetical protein
MKGISFLFIILFFGCASHEDPKDPIRDVFFSKLDEYRQCYLESNSYKGRSVKENGMMRFWLFANPNGLVNEIKFIHNDFNDANLNACILGYIKALKFPVSENGIEITQPLNFKPRDS